MKLQRHNVDNDRGEWCLSEDVEQLEAENESLRAELERLKAPPKKLRAEEVTEPGVYWWAKSKGAPFCEYPIPIDKMQIKRGMVSAGEYVGPLKPQEVGDAQS